MRAKRKTCIKADLMTAARFLVSDGESLDTREAVRIGLELAKLAGMMEGQDG